MINGYTVSTGDRFSLELADEEIALILAYGASTATTVVPTIAAILYHPVKPAFTTGETINLLASYIPFFLIPFGMALDMGIRLTKMINQSQVRRGL